MANEIKLNGYTTGVTLYAVIENVAGQVWRTDTNVFEAYTSANIASYAVSLSETAGTGRYRGSFPSGIASAGRYNVSTYQRAGGSPAITDTYAGGSDVEWKGAAELSQAADINATANTISTQTSAANQQSNVGAGMNAVGYTAFRASRLDNVDVTVGSRLATSGYTAPVNPTDYQQRGVAVTLPSSVLGTADHTAIQTDVTTGLTTQGYTTTRSGYMDTLNGIVGAIWASASRTLSAFGFNVAANNLPTDYQQRGQPVTLGSTDAANIAASASQTTSTNITNAAIAALTAQGYTVLRAGKLDNADVATSTRGTFSGGAVASVTAPVTLTSSEHTNIAADATSGVASISIEAGETFLQTIRLIRAVLAGNSTPTGNVIMFTRADGTTGALTITTNPTTGARSSSTPGTL